MPTKPLQKQRKSQRTTGTKSTALVKTNKALEAKAPRATVPPSLWDVSRAGDPMTACVRLLSDEAFAAYVTLLMTGKRSVEKRLDRALAVEMVSAQYGLLLRQFLGGPDASVLLDRLRHRQLFTRPGVEIPPSDRREALILAMSDCLAGLKDPCHKATWKYRRRGIARRPSSAMPLFAVPLPRAEDARGIADDDRASWRVVADRDLLEWIEEPFIDGEFRDEAREKYRITVPAPDTRGDVPIRRFCRWLGLSRATEFSITERKQRVGDARVLKEDSDIPGLYETPEGKMVVHLETYVLSLLDRRTARWTSALPVRMAPTAPFSPPDSAAGASAQGAEPAVEKAPQPVTPTEELLMFLEAKLQADLACERAKLLPVIEAERAAGEFVPGLFRLRSE